MDKVTTSDRLKQIMRERGLKQSDILRMIKPIAKRFGDDVGIGSNALSQYVQGKVLPRQDKLTLLGLALNVSEAWLMGYDVPKERTLPPMNREVSDSDLRLLDAYHANPSAQVFINRMLGLPEPDPEGGDAT